MIVVAIGLVLALLVFNLVATFGGPLIVPVLAALAVLAIVLVPRRGPWR